MAVVTNMSYAPVVHQRVRFALLISFVSRNKIDTALTKCQREKMQMQWSFATNKFVASQGKRR